MRAGGAMTTVGYYLTYLAEAYLAADAIPDGLAAVAEGRERCAREIACVHEPELLRLEAELLRRAGDDDAAEERLRRALALARARDARAWQLRAAVSLGRLLHSRGLIADAARVVQPVHDSFEPESPLPDLADARTLLSA